MPKDNSIKIYPYELRCFTAVNDCLQSNKDLGLFKCKDDAVKAAEKQVKLVRDIAVKANAKDLRGWTVEPDDSWMPDENGNNTIRRDIVAYSANSNEFETTIVITKLSTPFD